MQISNIPDTLNQALIELTIFRDELRKQGTRKHAAIREINNRINALVPNHTKKTAPYRFAHLIHQHGLKGAREMLRTTTLQ